jgi:MFS family permease
MATNASEKDPMLYEVPQGACHPSRRLYRYIVLACIAFICFGSYFSLDEIQPLGKSLESHLGISKEKFGLLYSVYSLPNIIVVFFGGMLGDRIGLRLAGMIFASLVFTGTFIVALSPQFENAFVVMIIGRVIFGMGGESLNVIQSSMVARWFARSTELAMAFGIVLSMSRLGDFLATSVGGQIAVAFHDYRATLYTGVILTAVSLFAVILYSFLDKYADKKLEREPLPPEKINFKAITKFDTRFWLLSFVTLTYYSGILPFVAVAEQFIEEKWGYVWSNDEQRKFWAEQLSSIIVLSAMILSPIFGKVLDVVGHRPYFTVAGACLLLPAHLMLGLSFVFPAIPIAMLGLSFSFVPSTIWPSIPLIIPEENTATAFGLLVRCV